MKRLTSHKAAKDMSMMELAFNCCFGKDGAAWYRDFETEIDARYLTMRLLRDLADEDAAFTCPEDFDDFMCDTLIEGFTSVRGLIAVFYRNLWAMAELRERLAAYEDQEETREIRRRITEGNFFGLKHE